MRGRALMRKKACVISCLAFSLLLALLSCPAEAVHRAYVEDFTTLQFCDGMRTLALWDTLAGELKLPPYDIVWLSHYNTPSDSCYGVAISGDYAYAGDYACGVQIFDIKDPAYPQHVATYDTPDYAHNITVSGDYAYVADWSGGLQVVDISDPTDPRYAGSYVTGCTYRAAISGDYAFLSCIGALKIMDISDPTNPMLVATSYLTGGGRYVEVSGDYAYVADGADGLRVIDISNPLEPAHVGSCATPGFARGLDVSGDYVCIGGGVAGLVVVDVSDPANPVHIGTYDTPGNARRVAMCGTCVYVADHNTGIVALDISDPANPEYIGSCVTPCNAHGVAVDGEHAYVVDWCYGFHVAHIADFLESPLPSGSCLSLSDAHGVATAGHYACVSDGASGVKVIDIGDPQNPVVTGSCDTPGEAYGVALAGDYAYVGDCAHGLQIVSISDLTDPELVGNCDTPGEAHGVDVFGNYACIADGICGLRIIDITDCTNPAPAGSCDTPGEAYGVAVSGNYAYVGDGSAGLQVVDITDPTYPILRGSYDTPGEAHGVVISGDYAYVGDGASGLQIVDITDPANPASAGNYDTPGDAHDVAIAGNYVCVGDGASGLQIIDVSDAANPTLAAVYDTPGDAHGVVISCDHVCVGDGLSGLHLIKIFERHLDGQNCTAHSLPIDGSDDLIVGARLATGQTDSILWDLSSDGGANWREAAPADTFSVFSSAGSSLLWKSRHCCVASGFNPCCTDLEIEWLFEFAVIDSISDVPDDQGHQVRIVWTKSGYDDAECSPPITEYTVFRRADQSMAQSTNLAERRSDEIGRVTGAEDSEAPATFPPGVWDSVGTIIAGCGPSYVATVPTSIDSTVSGGMHHSVFFIRAWISRPGVFYDSPVDSGYSVDNLAPSPPGGLAMASPAQLIWNETTEEDFDHFTVYGSDVSGFDSTAVLLDYTVDNEMDVSEDVYGHYHVTATDVSGNEGDASSIENPNSACHAGDLPTVYILTQNSPNPFQTTTVIGFDLPKPTPVDLSVFDIEGRLVTRLSTGPYPAGRHSVSWTGLDDHARRTCPGIYFVKMEADGFRATRKMIRLR